jgi:MFS family permease
MIKKPPQFQKEKRKVLKSLGVSLLALLFFGAVGTMIAIVPDPKHRSIIGLVTAWGLSLVIAVSGFSNMLKPNLLALFMVEFSLSTLFLAAAIHGWGTYLSGWIWIVPLSGAYLLAWILPILNPSLARVLSNEQMAPNKRLGKNLSLIVLCIAGVSGILGAFLGLLSHRLLGTYTPAMLFIGTLGAFCAIGLGQYYSYQLWERRQKEKEAGIHHAN